MTRAQYTYVGSNDTTVWIADLGIGRSITNDAEAVVQDLLRKFGNKRFVYRDTADNWDELKHNGEQFTDFAPGRGSLEPTGQLF